MGSGLGGRGTRHAPPRPPFSLLVAACALVQARPRPAVAALVGVAWSKRGMEVGRVGWWRLAGGGLGGCGLRGGCGLGGLVACL